MAVAPAAGTPVHLVCRQDPTARSHVVTCCPGVRLAAVKWGVRPEVAKGAIYLAGESREPL
jgi:hypothetical protein